MKTAIYRLAVILTFCFLAASCTKDVITNDLGESFSYNSKMLTDGVVIGDIYSTGNFASFTDIAHYNNFWYVIFRTGTKHIGGLNGEIKILKSTDALTWTVDKIFKNDSLDLRDPKLIVDTADNELYISFPGIINNPQDPDYRLHNFISSYNNASGYDEARIIDIDSSVKERFAFWRYTYHKGKTYSASFKVPLQGGYINDNICLFDDNNDFRKYKSLGKLKLGSSPNEATIRFDEKDKMYFLIRREVANAALGFSNPPEYTNVTWLEDPLAMKLSSPNFLFYNNRLLICGRDQDDLKFKFMTYDPATNKIQNKFTFPSGMETGYAGMSFNPLNKDELFISYYVINDNTSFIKLIRMDLKTFLK